MRKHDIFSVLLVFLCTNFCSAQCLLKSTNLSQRLYESELVVEGKVIGQHSFWDNQHRLIYTAHTVLVYKVFKGAINSSTVEIVTPGGFIGNEGLEVTPSLHLETNNTGIFIVRRHRAAKRLGQSNSVLYQPIAAQASFIAYTPNSQKVKGVFENFGSRAELYDALTQTLGRTYTTKQEFPTPPQSRMMPSISSISTTNSSAGHGNLLVITGTNFGAVQGNVFFDSPDDGSGGSFVATPTDDILSWSNTSITVEIPGGAGTGGVIVQDNGGTNSNLSSTLTINFNISNTSDGDTVMLVDDGADGDGGYTFYFGTETANSGVDFTTEASGAAMAAFQRAVSTWQNWDEFQYLYWLKLYYNRASPRSRWH